MTGGGQVHRLHVSLRADHAPIGRSKEPRTGTPQVGRSKVNSNRYGAPPSHRRSWPPVPAAAGRARPDLGIGIVAGPSRLRPRSPPHGDHFHAFVRVAGLGDLHFVAAGLDTKPSARLSPQPLRLVQGTGWLFSNWLSNWWSESERAQTAGDSTSSKATCSGAWGDQLSRHLSVDPATFDGPERQM